VILFSGQIVILSFIEFLGFPVNRILCILFSIHDSTTIQYNTETPKYKIKELALKGIIIYLS
jgi:hypothetical protein